MSFKHLLGFLCTIIAAAGTYPALPKVPVYATASFEDKNGLFVENLSRSDVRVLEDGQPRPVEFMARDELPVVYGIVFERALAADSEWQDRRSGMGPAPGMQTAQDIAYVLIDKYLGQQAIWVGFYDTELQVALEPTVDGFRAKDAIHRIEPERHSESFLYSALFSAVKKMNERPEKRRVLLLFLNLLDSKTNEKLQVLKNLLSSSNVELFTFSFASRTGTAGTLSQAALRNLARVTAGSAFFASEYRDHPEDITRRVLNQLRTFYTIGFPSEADPAKGARLTIECTLPGVKPRHHPTVPILP